MPKDFENCKGTPLTEFSTGAFFAWLKNPGNANKSIEDIVCCMPQKFRDDYLVAHSSISAQASHYKSPRVIFGNIEDDGITFSIATNADPSLPQANNIEILVRQGARNEQLALYDLEITDGHKKMSESNPSLCISCHGHQQFKISGPRPIFDSFPWPRLTGFHMDACPQRVEFMKKATEIANTAVKESPRFKCLRPPGGSTINPASGALVARHSPLGFERSLLKENQKRIARELMQDPEFTKVQPFLVGLKKGCLISGPASSTDGKIIDSPESWFASRGRDEKLMNIDPGIAKSPSSTELYDYVRVRINQHDQKVAEQEAKFKKMTEMLENGQLPSFGSSHGSLKCIPKDSMQDDLQTFKDSAQKLSLEIQKYAYDDILKSIDNGQRVIAGELRLRESLMRWALESRGIDTLGWDIHVLPNYHFDVSDMINQLPLAAKYKQIPDSFASTYASDSSEYSETSKKWKDMCRELKALSLATQNSTKARSSSNQQDAIH